MQREGEEVAKQRLLGHVQVEAVAAAAEEPRRVVRRQPRLLRLASDLLGFDGVLPRLGVVASHAGQLEVQHLPHPVARLAEQLRVERRRQHELQRAGPGRGE